MPASSDRVAQQVDEGFDGGRVALGCNSQAEPRGYAVPTRDVCSTNTLIRRTVCIIDRTV